MAKKKKSLEQQIFNALGYTKEDIKILKENLDFISKFIRPLTKADIPLLKKGDKIGFIYKKDKEEHIKNSTVGIAELKDDYETIQKYDNEMVLVCYPFNLNSYEIKNGDENFLLEDIANGDTYWSLYKVIKDAKVNI